MGEAELPAELDEDRRRRRGRVGVRVVRSAVPVVYRHHPDVAREAAGAYERRRHAAARRAEAKGGAGAERGEPLG